jgi:hypothetical protein
VIRTLHPAFRPFPALWRVIGKWAGDDRASQIVEFAVSLPLLVLFVVGIFDFSSAITLKQKLTNAAREGARVAAADPANDLGGAVPFPASVGDALQVVRSATLLASAGWSYLGRNRHRLSGWTHRRAQTDHQPGMRDAADLRANYHLRGEHLCRDCVPV